MKNTPDEIVDIVSAFKAGKRIECCTACANPGDESWVEVECPCWDFSEWRYRVAPEPKLRPWKPEEVPADCWIRTTRNNSAMWRILAIQPSGVVSANASADNSDALALRSYDFLFRQVEHSTDGGKTWKPCGVEE